MKIRAAENGPLLIEANETRLTKDGKEEVISRKTIASLQMRAIVKQTILRWRT